MKKLLVNLGLPKTGTTYLGSILEKSNVISVSKIKEPTYFCKGDSFGYSLKDKVLVKGNLNRGINWYKSLFDESCLLFVDQSTQYWLHSAAVEVSAAEKFEVYPYVICRNSFDQIQSYIAHLRRGYLPEVTLENICNEDIAFKEYLTTMFEFSKINELKRGLLDGILYIDFKLLITRPDEVLEGIENYIGERVSFAVDQKEVSKNERGYPRFFWINAFITSKFVRAIGALLPSVIYNFLIPFRKKIIRINLKAGNSKWATTDCQYLKELFVHEG